MRLRGIHSNVLCPRDRDKRRAEQGVPTATVQRVRDCTQKGPAADNAQPPSPTLVHASTRGTQILIQLESGPLLLTHSYQEGSQSSTSGVLASCPSEDSLDDMSGTSENPRQATGHGASCLSLPRTERPRPSPSLPQSTGLLRMWEGLRPSNSENAAWDQLAFGGLHNPVLSQLLFVSYL